MGNRFGYNFYKVEGFVVRLVVGLGVIRCCTVFLGFCLLIHLQNAKLPHTNMTGNQLGFISWPY